MRSRSERFGPIRVRWEHLVLGGVLTLAAATPSAAQGYNTGAFVGSNQNECIGVPDCVTDVKPAAAVPPGGRIQTRFVCPEDRPNLWAWDVGQHEHITVKLAAVNRTSATIEAINHAGVEGIVVVSLGCSTKPYTGSLFLESRQLAPTGWAGPGTIPRNSDATRNPR